MNKQINLWKFTCLFLIGIVELGEVWQIVNLLSCILLNQIRPDVSILIFNGHAIYNEVFGTDCILCCTFFRGNTVRNFEYHVAPGYFAPAIGVNEQHPVAIPTTTFTIYTTKQMLTGWFLISDDLLWISSQLEVGKNRFCNNHSQVKRKYQLPFISLKVQLGRGMTSHLQQVYCHW